MALAERAELVARLSLDDQFSKKLGAADGAMKSFGKGVSTLAGNIAKMGAVAAVGMAGALVASVKEASNLSETVSKVGVVFKSSAASVLAFGDTAAAALGMSKNEALAAAGTYGNLFVSMGLADDASAQMSTSLVQLAGDLASFNNMGTDEVLEKLRAGLTGESEPLKTLGVNINEVIIKEKALALGLTKTTTGTLPAAIKAQAAYALIFEQTATAQGDFARTSGGLANQQRILKANLANTAATIGTALLPGVTKLAVKLNDLIIKNQPAIERFAEQLPAAFEGVVAFAEKIPWDAIGVSLQGAAVGAQALFSAFSAMPDDVKALLIGMVGLNKLTGGAVGSIVSELGKGLIKGVLGMNAGVVNINAGMVNGGGIGGAAGAAAGGISTLAKGLLLAEGAALVALVAGFQQKVSGETVGAAANVQGQAEVMIASSPTFEELTTAINGVDRGIKDINGNILYQLVGGKEAVQKLEATRAELVTARQQAYIANQGTDALLRANLQMPTPPPIVNVTVNTSVTARSVVDSTEQYYRVGSNTRVVAI